jgi:hypothetical protein
MSDRLEHRPVLEDAVRRVDVLGRAHAELATVECGGELLVQPGEPRCEGVDIRAIGQIDHLVAADERGLHVPDRKPLSILLVRQATARVLPWPDRTSHYEWHHKLTNHSPRALFGKDSLAPFQRFVTRR